MIDWYAQNAAFLKIWGEVQTQVVDAWGRIAQQAREPFKGHHAIFCSALLDASTEAIRQGIRAISSDATPTAREAAEKLFISQTSVVRLFEMTLRIWGSLLPVLEAGGDWARTLREQLTWVKAQTLQAATQNLHNTGTYQQLWSVYLKENQHFGKPWLANLDAHLQPSAGVGETAWEAYQKTFGELVSLPTNLNAREIDDEMHNAFMSWVEMQQALYDYNTILSETWVNAFELFIFDLIRLTQAGETLESVRDLLNRWSTVADNAFKQSFLTEGYVRSQSRLVETVVKFRQQQRQVNERFMQMFDLPTRSEIDEAHLRIHDLRKEVRELKREIAWLRQAIQGAAT